MLFCPKCGVILVPKRNSKKGLVCSCGYNSKDSDVIIKEKTLVTRRNIEVVDKKIETLPKIAETCPKCNNREAYYWLVQTRAADEAETRFFRCTNCEYTWRAYN